jgi:hypothetical protein
MKRSLHNQAEKFIRSKDFRFGNSLYGNIIMDHFELVSQYAPAGDQPRPSLSW